MKIATDAQHAEALRAIEELWDAVDGTVDGDRFEALVAATHEYEETRWPMDVAKP